MDLVAQDLSVIQEQLDAGNHKYTITKTSPTRDLLKLDEDSLYIIRQQVDEHGIYHLVTAAKMKKAECVK